MGCGQILEWLGSCEAYHPSCNEGKLQTLPTRVVNVEPGPYIKIAETNGTLGRYACLSHCWGEAALVSTTIETLREHINTGIAWELLPKTFQDAIVVTRALGIPYLWIDSLCIVQNDTQDWARESVKMAEIYRHGEITLAATKSPDGHGGCFSEIEPYYRGHNFRFRGVEVCVRKKLPHKAFREYPLVPHVSTINCTACYYLTY